MTEKSGHPEYMGSYGWLFKDRDMIAAERDALAARVVELEKQQRLALELELARVVPIPEGYKEQ